MIVVGILLVIIAEFVSYYLVQLDSIKNNLNLPIPYEFMVSGVVFLFAFFIYYFIQKIQFQTISKDLQNLINEINNFRKENTFNIETKNKYLFHTFSTLNELVNEFIKKEETYQKKLQICEHEESKLNAILDLENVLLCTVTEGGKVIKANTKFLKFLNYENEAKLNMKVKHVFDIFDEKIDKDFNEIIGKDEDIEVSIQKVQFLLHIEKISKELEYVITLIDISSFEEEKTKFKKEMQYVSKNLKTVFAINKTLETVMIKVLNYDNYVPYLGAGILEAFEDKFVERIISLGYEDVFKVQNNIFAINDFHIDFDKYKKTLEENIIISIGNDKYIFTPKIVLSSGVNFEQAYQQIAESSKTLISKQKVDSKYDLEFIKFINKSILENNIYLGYKEIKNEKNTVVLYPVIKDEYGTILPYVEVNALLREFNLYLYVMKQLILNNLNILKNSKLILNVTSEELLATTMLSDLLSLIKREELMVVFNVKINSSYSVIKPLLKQIKSFAQLGFRHVGNGYISYIDIYALKVEYLEIDEKLAELVKNDKNWKFLVDSIKLITIGQHTKILSTKYQEDKVYQISNELKICSK